MKVCVGITSARRKSIKKLIQTGTSSKAVPYLGLIGECPENLRVSKLKLTPSEIPSNFKIFSQELFPKFPKNLYLKFRYYLKISDKFNKIF